MKRVISLNSCARLPRLGKLLMTVIITTSSYLGREPRFKTRPRCSSRKTTLARTTSSHLRRPSKLPRRTLPLANRSLTRRVNRPRRRSSKPRRTGPESVFSISSMSRAKPCFRLSKSSAGSSSLSSRTRLTSSTFRGTRYRPTSATCSA